jgi:hypothetical protein
MNAKHTPASIIGDDLFMQLVLDGYIVLPVGTHSAMLEALKRVAHSGEFSCFDEDGWSEVNTALSKAQVQS